MKKTVDLPASPPRWEMSNVYTALESPEFQRAFEQLKTRLDAFVRYLEEEGIQKGNRRPGVDAAALAPAVEHLLDEINFLLEHAGTLRAYIASFVTTDSYNEEARKAMSRLEQQYVRFQQATTRARGWIGEHGDLLPQVFEIRPKAAAHRFALQEIVEQSRYLMSQAEEDLAAELSLSGATAWSKLQGTVTSQLSVEFEVDGEVKSLPMPALINLR
ncbi:MAG: hypothetical protein D6803_00510, partial [Anaerolineae bacterium]